MIASVVVMTLAALWIVVFILSIVELEKYGGVPRDAKVSVRFALFDPWIGCFHDRGKGIWYWCPLPCLLVKFERPARPMPLKKDPPPVTFVESYLKAFRFLAELDGERIALSAIQIIGSTVTISRGMRAGDDKFAKLAREGLTYIHETEIVDVHGGTRKVPVVRERATIDLKVISLNRDGDAVSSLILRGVGVGKSTSNRVYQTGFNNTADEVVVESLTLSYETVEIAA